MKHDWWHYTTSMVGITVDSFGGTVVKCALDYTILSQAWSGEVNHCSTKHVSHARKERQWKSVSQ